MPLKLSLLAFVILGIVAAQLRDASLGLHSSLVAWTLFYVLIGVVYILIGLGRAPSNSFIYVALLYVVFPVVYIQLASGIKTWKVHCGLENVMIAGGVAAGLYMLSIFLVSAGVLPTSMMVSVDQTLNVSIKDGVPGIQLPAVSTLVFLVPYFMTALVVRAHRGDRRQSTFWMWTALIASASASVLTGRRALLLVILLAPIIATCLLVWMPDWSRKQAILGVLRLVAAMAVVVLVFGGALGWLIDVDYAGYLQSIRGGFDFSGSTTGSAFERQGQFYALLDGWSESPLIGYGHGVACWGWERSADKPWRYELSYMSLLFHTGVIGFCAYAAGIAWLFWRGFQALRGGGKYGAAMAPLMVGLVCMLVAYGTNPYFDAFDALWTLFLPLSLVNRWLASREIRHSLAGEQRRVK